MAEKDAALEAIGIQIVGDSLNPRVHAECIRMARRLRAAQRKVIGLIPAGADAAVPPVAVNLGMALVELSGATVAYVDANVHWPAISKIALGMEPDGGDSVFSTRWLRGSLALLTPPVSEKVGQVGPQLRRALADGRELFEYVLVDLTGFDLLGEQVSAQAIMDGVIVVARAGRTREGELLRLQQELGGPKLLGVLLIG